MIDLAFTMSPRDLQSVPAKLSKTLAEQAAAFDRLARNLRRKPTVDGVHDLRVLTRRLRAAIQVAGALLPPSNLRELRKRLRKLGRRLGDLRILDVALEDAKTYDIDGSPLDARRDEARAALIKALRTVRRAWIVRELKTASRSILEADRDRVAEILDRRADRLREALDRAPESKARMHELRIQLKKARYALEALGRDAEPLKPLQRHLGRSHDLECLQELLGENARVARDEEREREAGRKIMTKIVQQALEALA